MKHTRPHERPTGPTRWLSAAAGLVLLTGAGGASAPSEVSLPDDALRAIRALQGDQPTPSEEVLPVVEAYAPEIVSELLVLLELGTVPALGDEPEQVLSRYQEALILAVFESSGREAVAGALEPFLEGEPPPARVAAGILAVGAVGQSPDLRQLIGMALEPDEETLEPVVEAAVEKAVYRVLEADPRAFSHLSTLVQQVRAELLPALIRAVGHTSDGRGVEIMQQILVWRPELAPLAVAQIRRLGPAPSPQVNADVADLLRPQLDPSNPDFCRAVALVLGELEDYHSVPRLIQLLEDGSEGIRANALWALRRLAGSDWAANPQWWKLWYQEELDWYQHQRRHARRLLSNPKQGKAAEALREYGDHRLFRHELAADVREALRRRERSVRELACEVLGQLGSPYSVPALVEVLEEDEPTVREAAWKALVAITGDDHPADSSHWVQLAARR